MTIRGASQAPFPYGWPGPVSYFIAQHDSVVQLTTREELRQAVTDALRGGGPEIFAAWPGQYRTDLFHIDRPELLAEAIGLVTA